MTVERLGFFRELRHGDPSGPSLREAVSEPLPADVRERVASYLAAGPVVVATTQRADDALDPSKTEVSGISVRTDGVRVWSEDLAYYVRTYGARVPAALVDAALSGLPPALDDAELTRIGETLWPSSTGS